MILRCEKCDSSDNELTFLRILNDDTERELWKCYICEARYTTEYGKKKLTLYSGEK